MKRVVIVHGANGSPEENWFPWLKKELESKGIEVIIPQFPGGKDQNFEQWLGVFKADQLDEDTILVGHSLGVAFILRLLEHSSCKVRACFLVAGFASRLNNKFDKITRTFVDQPFAWGTIQKNCKKFFVYASDNDPYVPMAKAKELGEKIHTAPILVKNAGHFNEAAGYTSFQLLLADILRLLN